jgi:hypothetical protein
MNNINTLNTKNISTKHLKYKYQYKQNVLYWGIGIENELYLEFTNKKKITKKQFINNHKRERYSIDYFTNYKKEYLDNVFNHLSKNIIFDIIELPLLMNSNSFIKTDCYNNPMRLYTKECELNPKFEGNTLIDKLKLDNTYFTNSYNDKWLFDGDTIEFTTNNFFNNNLENIINELDENKNEFINELNNSFNNLNIFNEYGKIKFMENNHPFSCYLTNLDNVGIFNNGTLHYNLTLPCELNEKYIIKNIPKFIKDHSKAIKIIQWFEPFLIAVYGSPDSFNKIENYIHNNKFSGGSQRCAVSRYISIGTYDSDKMETGKKLTEKTSDMVCNNLDFWWFNKYYEDNAYTKLNEIGMDINFNKHYNHGIEIRFFDHIKDSEKIYESFEFIIYLMDYILESDDINNFENPIINKDWNNITLNVIKYGKEYNLTNDEKKIFELMFKNNFIKNNIFDLFYEIYWYLILNFNKIYKLNNNNKKIFYFEPNGIYSSLTLQNKSNDIFNEDLIEINKNIYMHELFDNKNMCYNCCNIS